MYIYIDVSGCIIMDTKYVTNSKCVSYIKKETFRKINSRPGISSPFPLLECAYTELKVSENERETVGR